MTQQTKPALRARTTTRDSHAVLCGLTSLVLIGFAGMALPVKAAPQASATDATLLLTLHRLASNSFAPGASNAVLDKQSTTQEVSR